MKKIKLKTKKEYELKEIKDIYYYDKKMKKRAIKITQKNNEYFLEFDTSINFNNYIIDYKIYNDDYIVIDKITLIYKRTKFDFSISFLIMFLSLLITYLVFPLIKNFIIYEVIAFIFCLSFFIMIMKIFELIQKIIKNKNYNKRIEYD